MAVARERCALHVAGAIALLALSACGGCGATRELRQAQAIPLPQLTDVTARQQIVVLGQTHLESEPIDTAKELLGGADDFTHLALEWPVSDQPAFDAYMAGNEAALIPLKQYYSRFPTIGAESFELLAFVRNLNRQRPERQIRVWLIDVPQPVRSTAEERRDQHMAERIAAAFASRNDARVLVCVGADHAAKTGTDMYPDGRGRLIDQEPLGALLRERFGNDGVALVKVLSPADRLWERMRRCRRFDSPVALRLTPSMGEAQRLFRFYGWRPSAARSAGSEVFDYVVWWPTCRRITRLPDPSAA